MKIAIIAITKAGKKLAEKLAARLENSQIISGAKTATLLKDNWHQYDGFVLIIATGIVVRSIAPLIQDKRQDPAIVTMDETGKYAISLLSGHLGGANELTQKVATLVNAQAVISTASDCQNLPALDLWARDNHLETRDNSAFTTVSAALVNGDQVKVFINQNCQPADIPTPMIQTPKSNEANIIVSFLKNEYKPTALNLVPKKLIVGIGCKRNTSLSDLKNALTELCDSLQIPIKSIIKICSIDAKSDEVGLLELSKELEIPCKFFNKKEINQFTELQVSAMAMKAVGAIGVAEPTAMLGARTEELFSHKRKWSNITMALAISKR
ncbi:MAG: cobalamin biosynthesis protein [Desulfotalea sp.]